MTTARHVVLTPSGGWGVIKGGARRASKLFETKKEAETYGRSLSEREGSDLVVHERDGTVQHKESHARRPHPSARPSQ